MGDKRDSESWEESEFGLGDGMIDPTARAARAIEPWQQMAEIKAMPKTFDHSMPARGTVETTPVPRLAPGEKATDRS